MYRLATVFGLAAVHPPHWVCRLRQKSLNIYEVDDEFELREVFGTISFKLPIYDVEIELHNGFWNIESYCHYCQIVMHHGDYFWLRRSIYDIVRALGQNEAWHAAEY